MKEIRRIQASLVHAGMAFLMAILVCGFPVLNSAQTKPHAGKSFAQKLVEATQAKHPESDEIGISAITSRGCIGIASTRSEERRVG